MVKYPMFTCIQYYKQQGFSQSEIFRETGLDRKTIRKFMRMTPTQYASYVSESQERTKAFADMKEEILEIYRINGWQKLNMTSVYDCLEEKHKQLPGNEQTLRNYIRYLIESKSLELQSRNRRVYIPVKDLPLGKQLQLDFGQDKDVNGVKRYLMATVLSASRFKFGVLQGTPFTTGDLIRHLLDCFEFIGGIPEEVVIDQDSLMVVSENLGEIIYTKGFKDFQEEMGFQLWVCRKADPESKGKVEATVHFFKSNFLSTRSFADFDEANTRLRQWLHRRGNGRLSRATRRIPNDVIEEERQHLRPLKHSIFEKPEMVDLQKRKVSPLSEVLVKTNHYPVPEEYRGCWVGIRITTDRLHVYDLKTGSLLKDHPLQLLQGQRIRETERESIRTGKLDTLKQEAATWYPHEQWKHFLQLNHRRYPRYFRDQLRFAHRHLRSGLDTTVLNEALDYCLDNRTLSMQNLRDTYLFIRDRGAEIPTTVQLSAPRFGGTLTPPRVAKRSLAFYQDQITQRGGDAR